MTREKFYEIFGNINEDFVQEAHISRPDFVGLEKGGIYTLKEMQEILTEAYKSE